MFIGLIWIPLVVVIFVVIQNRLNLYLLNIARHGAFQHKFVVTNREEIEGVVNIPKYVLNIILRWYRIINIMNIQLLVVLMSLILLYIRLNNTIGVPNRLQD